MVAKLATQYTNQCRYIRIQTAIISGADRILCFKCKQNNIRNSAKLHLKQLQLAAERYNSRNNDDSLELKKQIV